MQALQNQDQSIAGTSTLFLFKGLSFFGPIVSEIAKLDILREYIQGNGPRVSFFIPKMIALFVIVLRSRCSECAEIQIVLGAL